jgi:hypothetical protein
VFDRLIVDSQLSVRQQRRIIESFQNLFGSWVGQFPIADQDAKPAKPAKPAETMARLRDPMRGFFRRASHFLSKVDRPSNHPL